MLLIAAIDCPNLPLIVFYRPLIVLSNINVVGSLHFPHEQNIELLGLLSLRANGVVFEKEFDLKVLHEHLRSFVFEVQLKEKIRFWQLVQGLFVPLVDLFRKPVSNFVV